MKSRSFALAVFVLIAACITPMLAGRAGEASLRSQATAANPQMERLAKALAGDWNTAESMGRSEFFPTGGMRHGVSHIRLGIGGTTLINEGESDGSAGKLSHLIVIWWDVKANTYRFFTCFNDPEAPCEQRGTAHWVGNTFVNDYQEIANGRRRTFRDSFTQLTPDSRLLVEYVRMDDGSMKPIVTTKSTRRKGA